MLIEVICNKLEFQIINMFSTAMFKKIMLKSA
jgi:hypothetical protein